MKCYVAQTVEDLIDILKTYPLSTPIVASCDEEGNAFSLGVSIGFGTAGDAGVPMTKNMKVAIIYPYEQL